MNNNYPGNFTSNKCMKNFPRLQITMNNVTNVPKTSVNLDPISRMVFDNSSTEKQIQSVAQSVAFMDKLGASEVIEFIEFKKAIRAKNKAWSDAHPVSYTHLPLPTIYSV